MVRGGFGVGKLGLHHGQIESEAGAEVGELKKITMHAHFEVEEL